MPYVVNNLSDAQTAVNDLAARCRRLERVVKQLSQMHLGDASAPHAFNDPRLRAAADMPDPVE